jgi:hypothetical protein
MLFFTALYLVMFRFRCFLLLFLVPIIRLSLARYHQSLLLPYDSDTPFLSPLSRRMYCLVRVTEFFSLSFLDNAILNFLVYTLLSCRKYLAVNIEVLMSPRWRCSYLLSLSMIQHRHFYLTSCPFFHVHAHWHANEHFGLKDLRLQLNASAIEILRL